MPKVIDITGQSFGRLTVVSYAGSIRGKPSWHCDCACGARVTVRGDMLKCGNTRSCGCLLIESATRHGHNRATGKPSPTYVTWMSMRSRCNNPAHDGYKHYGAIGVRVHPEWDSFDAFLRDMGERPAGMTLNRIDNSRGYEPGNCEWATALAQSRNRRSSRFLTVGDMRLTVSEWAERTGVPRDVLQDRIRLGWSDQRIVETPYSPRKS